ncbi:uncharacterized protein K02A2.6-like [Anneissia japonica]|uniref:uncharacterized protein K02A2.6-like n=1 Tax=Anneissia japonica TaxID=1529436 RepID=UPI00142593C9|nr:uncharacterized protein K02A2.6-like [Anneissia japonica]
MKSQQPEPLMQQKIPEGPWQVVAEDLFYFHGDEHLAVADYYSKIPFVKKIGKRSTSMAVIKMTKSIFSEHGIPNKVVSDNGPRFSSTEFRQFVNEWEIEHVTSSPHYPISNGFIEKAIQAIKSTLQKSKDSGSVPFLALLCLRTPPIDSYLPPPTELLYNRKLRSNLPIRYQDDDHHNKVTNRLIQRQTMQKTYHDKSGVKNLVPLKEEQVTVQDPQNKDMDESNCAKNLQGTKIVLGGNSNRRYTKTEQKTPSQAAFNSLTSNPLFKKIKRTLTVTNSV